MIYIESNLPDIQEDGLNTAKPVNFAGSPQVILSPVTNAFTVTSLGTTQNSTPTIAQLLGGVVTQTGATGAGTVTLPTGTLISAAFSTLAVGYSFECIFANLGGSETLTITGATGSTVLGTAAVGTGKNAQLTFVNTGTNTWNVYCVVSA